MTSTIAPGPPQTLRAAAVVASCAAAAGYLHRLGSEPWTRTGADGPLLWLTRTPTEDVVAALLRLAALGACWWVVGTFLVALLVRAAGWRPAIRLTDRFTPRLVRGLAQRLTGGALLAASILGPTSPAVAMDDFAPPGATTRRVPTSAPVEVATPPGPSVSARPGATPGPERRVRVVPGDHLWGIARAEVARRRGLDPHGATIEEVPAYWRRVVEANEHRLRSGDADLLFPGEEIVLPRH